MQSSASTLHSCRGCHRITCGAGHPAITRITVTPVNPTVSATANLQFIAMASFSNNSSRELTQADGLSWSSSNTGSATISTTSSATCVSDGQLTITATAPANLNVTVNNGVNNTSPNQTATTQLTCAVFSYPG